MAIILMRGKWSIVVELWNKYQNVVIYLKMAPPRVTS
ncbi:uncharacterized protein G2W53_042216 [Senna tora]|uniref:Uncharacterized protein n=1 Tax=Senna tora TaxID=362788 RepID=A0A834VZR1_9FABA|nr:uncharacterized protein G2W53_042216 [Senna tora]